MEKTHYKNDLQNISESRLTDLIEEFKILEQQPNTICYYVIDPFDLQNYLFPFGLRSNDRRRNAKLDTIITETIALHSIFEDLNSRIFVFDEYIPELIHFVHTIKRVLNDKDYKNYERNQLTEILASRKDEHLKDIKKSLRFIATTSIGITKNAIDRLRELTAKKKLIINSSDLIGSQLPHEFTSSFDLNRPNELYKKYYALATKNDSASSEELQRNIRIDCRAADRIISINQYLQKLYDEQKIQNRFLLLYLSSAERMNRLFSMEEVKEDFPVINGKPFNIHRNTSQLYYKYLFNDFQKPSESLNVYKKLYTKEVLNSNIPDSLKIYFDTRISELKNAFENKVFDSKFENFKDEMKAAENATNVEQIKLFFSSANNKFSKIDKNQSLNEALEILSTINIKVNLKASFHAAIQYLKELNSISYEFTNDIVKSRAQVFPILFKNLKNKQCIEVSKLLIDRILKLKSNESNDYIDSLCLSLFELLKEEGNDAKLVALFFLLLVEPSHNFNHVELVYNEINSEFLNNLPENDKKLKPDFIYLSVWAARKNRKESMGDWYLRSEEISQYGIDEFPNDPRFYHGLGLALYCQAIHFGAESYLTKNTLSNIECDRILDRLKRSLTCMQTALEKFDSDSIGFVSEYKIEVENAISNSIAFIYFLIAMWESPLEKTNYLHKARESINVLKGIEKFDSYPEFLHTLASISFEEYNLTHAPFKIEESFLSMRKALLLSPNNKKYEALVNRMKRAF